MYIQSNISKLYQFEADVRALQQNTMSVHDFFVAVLIYEIQLALKEYHEMKACWSYNAKRKEQYLLFLWNCGFTLKDHLEQSPYPYSHCMIVHELSVEETRMKSQVDN